MSSPAWTKTFSVQLEINADDLEAKVSPPEFLLDVAVVADVAFLQLVKYEEDAKTSTMSKVGQLAAVDLRALLYALISQSSIDIAHLIPVPALQQGATS